MALKSLLLDHSLTLPRQYTSARSLPFGVCCTCWHNFFSFSIRINHLHCECPFHGPFFPHQRHMYMIDRNSKAGQCVFVGMKRMTEVASTMNHLLQRPNATAVIVPYVSYHAFAKYFLSFSRYFLIGCPAKGLTRCRSKKLNLAGSL